MNKTSVSDFCDILLEHLHIEHRTKSIVARFCENLETFNVILFLDSPFSAETAVLSQNILTVVQNLIGAGFQCWKGETHCALDIFQKELSEFLSP